MSNTKLKVIDLFCGIGGASTGISNAGIDVVAAVDHDETALQTYRDNLNHNTIQHDLGEVDLSILPTTDVDWIHASAPCKGYTTAGSQDTNDPRNSLLFDALEWIREIRPEYVTLENVTGLLHMETPDGKDVTDEAWLVLVEIVEDTEVGDEIHATDKRFYEALGEDTEAESKALTVLDKATELGFIEQVDDRAWTPKPEVTHHESK